MENVVNSGLSFYGTGKVVVKGDLKRGDRIDTTGGVVVEGNVFGVIDCSGPVEIQGHLHACGKVKNTGGGRVNGNLAGVFDSTGKVLVLGDCTGKVVGAQLASDEERTVAILVDAETLDKTAEKIERTIVDMESDIKKLKPEAEALRAEAQQARQKAVKIMA